MWRVETSGGGVGGGSDVGGEEGVIESTLLIIQPGSLFFFFVPPLPPTQPKNRTIIRVKAAISPCTPSSPLPPSYTSNKGGVKERKEKDRLCFLKGRECQLSVWL